MNTQKRTFGQNLCIVVKKKDISVSEMADELGYTKEELERIMESRLFVNSQEKKDIADYVKEPIEFFSKEPADAELVESGYMECRGEFSSVEKRELIFDLFDAYCDVQELLVQGDA